MKKYIFPLRAKSGRHISGNNRDQEGGGWNTSHHALRVSKRPGQIGLKFRLREEGLIREGGLGTVQSLFYNIAGAKRNGVLLFFRAGAQLGQHFLLSKYERA